MTLGVYFEAHNSVHISTSYFFRISFNNIQFKILFSLSSIQISAGPSCRAVESVGLRPLACWGCGLEFRRGHGGLSLVNVVCYQVDISATSWSVVQRSLTDCGASLCVIKKPREWGCPGPLGGCCIKKRRCNSQVFRKCYVPRSPFLTNCFIALNIIGGTIKITKLINMNISLSCKQIFSLTFRPYLSLRYVLPVT